MPLTRFTRAGLFVSLLAPLLVTGCQHWHFSDIDPPPGQVPDGPDIGFPPFDFDMGPPGPQPIFGPTVTAPTPPPPLSGGTLIALADGNTLVAADPDRDQVYVVDAAFKTVKTVALQSGDEPGKLAEDSAGRVHVALRRGGALVTIDTTTATVTERRAVCPAPRGVAYQSAGDLVHVACAGGELVSFPAAGGAATRTLNLERDLRDIVIDGSTLLVSRFRSAELLRISSTGSVMSRQVPPVSVGQGPGHMGQSFIPEVAWRTVARPGGGAFMVHQRSLAGPVQTNPGSPPGAYGGFVFDPCGGPIVHTAVTPMEPGQTVGVANMMPGAVLPIDAAVDPHSNQIAVLGAGNAKVALPQVFVSTTDTLTNGSGCVGQSTGMSVPGEAIALVYMSGSRLVVQTREPAALYFEATATSIPLSVTSVADTGHAVFHSNAGATIACASCHPEGGDDGHVWTFANSGARRTQNIRGGIIGGEPFHWDGDMPSFRSLVDEVFSHRMSGPILDPSQEQAALSWIDHIPALPHSPPADPAAVGRGSAIFNGDAGCTACHTGTRYSNNQTIDVGTGGKFQVPSLRGVVWRAPYLHDGCAPSLKDRFGSCGGGDNHGVTSTLTSAQIADLVAFLETL